MPVLAAADRMTAAVRAYGDRRTRVLQPPDGQKTMKRGQETDETDLRNCRNEFRKLIKQIWRIAETGSGNCRNVPEKTAERKQETGTSTAGFLQKVYKRVQGFTAAWYTRPKRSVARTVTRAPLRVGVQRKRWSVFTGLIQS